MNEDLLNEGSAEEPLKEENVEEMEEMKETEVVKEEAVTEEPAAAPMSEAVSEEADAGTPAPAPIPPKKKRNMFFLAALIPFLLIAVFAVILLVSGIGGKDKEQIEQTEEQSSGPVIKAGELRGVYIATAYNINYPSAQSLSEEQLKSELTAIIDTCKNNGFNAVYFQVSPFSDALYSSDILPTSAMLTGSEGSGLPGGFDPLAYLCERAHAEGIAVHAWINPMRVTGGSLDAEELSADNPAVVNEEFTVTYDGEIYYNLGVPEARHLQARVCAELAQKYPIDGILFDDYFYPYPVDGVLFDDSAAYSKHGGEYDSVEDFRRASVTALVEECYDAIKATRADCRFGVAPFGIWRNDDGANGGSATRGFESYESLYCDSLAFIEKGIVDYIAPQIYWTFDTEVAPYGELCDWWAEAVEGSDVTLYISHAAYRAGEWADPDEYSEQVTYARCKGSYNGSIFYGYEAIAENEGGIVDAFAVMYAE